MQIKQEPLQHWIDHFFGYGSWNARAWFIAHEEGGGDLPEEVAEKLNYFSSTHPNAIEPTLCNLRELYRNVMFRNDGPKAESFASLFDYRFGGNATLNTIWKNLITFDHAYRGVPQPDIHQYQRESFTSSSVNNEALIRFFPLPSPHNHAWYYSWLQLPGFEFLKSRTQYEQHLFRQRMDSILSRIHSHKPEIVLMYGMSNINALKKSVQEFFHGVNFKMMKAIKLHTPQYHRADFGGTTLLITTQIPALRHNRIETGFDWDAFGKIVKEGR